MKKIFSRLFLWMLILAALDIVIVGILALGANKVFTNPLTTIELFREQELFKKFLNYQGIYVLIIAIAAAYLKTGKNSSEIDTHGSARWAKPDEIRKVLNYSKGIILGKKVYLNMDSPLNKNIIIVGSSGTGKSRGYIKPNILQMNGSYVITDPKGEIFDDTSEYLKINGYRIKVLNLINLAASDLYNPLAYITDYQDIHILAKTIIDNTSNGALNIGEDSFWANSEMALLTALIAYVKSELPERQRNLTSVLKLLLAAAKGDKLDEIFFRLPDNHKALTSYKIFCLSGDLKTRGNIMIGLGVRLQILQSEGIARLTSGDTLELSQIGKSKTAVYIITSDSHRTYDFISSMFFSQLFQNLYSQADGNGGKLKVPVMCLLDEFSNIGKIPDFSSKVSSMRSRDISVSIVVQSLGQLKAKYEKQWADIMGNCDTLIFLGSQDIETARYISERLGKTTVISKTKSLSIPLRNSARGSRTESEAKTARALLTPDEITRLAPEKSIIFVQGLYPILNNKFDFETHKDYVGIRKADHNQYRPDYLPEHDTLRDVFSLSPTDKETPQKSKEEIKEVEVKEETVLDNMSIFENADFGR